MKLTQLVFRIKFRTKCTSQTSHIVKINRMINAVLKLIYGMTLIIATVSV